MTTIATHQKVPVGTSVSQALPSSRMVCGQDVQVTSCTCEVSAVRPGDAFVLCATSQHAASHAQQAVERGATAIVSEMLVPAFGVAQYLVEDAQQAYSELCQALVGHPALELNAIGIAGQHGKTSIALLVDSILNMAGKSVATATDQFTRVDGDKADLLPPVTAPAVADFMDEAVASGCRQAVIELTPKALQTKAAHAVEFDVVCLANLHVDNGSPQSPAVQRERLAESLDLLSPQGMAVLNADDPNSMRILAEYDGPVLTFGLSDAADITALRTEQYTNEQMFVLVDGHESAAVRTKVVGETHVQNCLAAAAIAKVYGVSLVDIVRGIERVTKIPGVMHRFDAGLGVSVFVDRGTSVMARSSTLKSLREIASGKLIAVVDTDCQVSNALADQTITTNKITSHQVVTDAVARVLGALEVTDASHLQVITQKLAGVALALLSADEGDTVVVSGWHVRRPTERRASVAVSDEQLIKSLMHEITSGMKRAA